MILTGVIGGVIVIIAIAMVIILCQRREKKPEGKEGAIPVCKFSHEYNKIQVT